MPGHSNLFKADKQNMYNVLLTFPEQVRHAITIGNDAPFFNSKKSSSKDITVLGLGGSAIGADLVRSFFNVQKSANHLRVTVSRGYDLPADIKEGSLVLASSYSGDTEETLSAFNQARKAKANIMCISTGGKISELARKNTLPLVVIPKGSLLKHPSLDSKFTNRTLKELDGVVSTLEELSEIYADTESRKNIALQLAKKLSGTAPVIYSASERMDSVNLRWRGQIQENAKNVAFGNLLPEMNHNEINGWTFPKKATKNFSAILLRDVDDHPRVSIRFDALKDIIKGDVKSVTEIWSMGDSLLARMFALIYLGDWVSYYMAMLNNVDPSPVPVITKLKGILAGK
jgi:glucose/mannose-6-phosphate isomerase